VSEADRIAKVYRDPGLRSRSSRWDPNNPGNRAIYAERHALTESLLRERGYLPLRGHRVLEVGSGLGAELASMVEFGASTSDLVGVELLPERVELARQAHPGIEFRAGDAEKLDFPDASFDLVMAITIFTSILDRAVAAGVANEIRRVLKPRGAVLWYDFRYDNPSNRNVRGIGESEVRKMFPGFQGRLHTVTLIPQIARRLGPLTSVLYSALAAVPPLRSHLLGLLQKPNDAV
jgi:ubiquinone/menaquinone biosynthesis C-methylase UbiE